MVLSGLHLTLDPFTLKKKKKNMTDAMKPTIYQRIKMLLPEDF